MNGMNEKGEARDSSGTRRFSRGRDEHEQKYKYSRRRLARLSLGPRGFAPRFVSFVRERRPAAGRCPFRRVVEALRAYSGVGSRRATWRRSFARARTIPGLAAAGGERRESLRAGAAGSDREPATPSSGRRRSRLRRAAVLREQASLAPAPDVLAGLRHGPRDDQLVHAVRPDAHLRARADALDGGLGRVELCCPPSQFYACGGNGDEREETARENERRRARVLDCRGASDPRR